MLCLAKILEDFLKCVSKALENCPFLRGNISRSGELRLELFFHFILLSKGSVPFCLLGL